MLYLKMCQGKLKIQNGINLAGIWPWCNYIDFSLNLTHRRELHQPIKQGLAHKIPKMLFVRSGDNTPEYESFCVCPIPSALSQLVVRNMMSVSWMNLWSDPAQLLVSPELVCWAVRCSSSEAGTPLHVLTWWQGRSLWQKGRWSSRQGSLLYSPAWIITLIRRHVLRTH